MNRTAANSIAIACGLALSLSTLTASAFARGGGGGSSGHSSSGMSHSGRSMSAPQNFSRSTNHMSTPNSHMSTPHMSNSHPSNSRMSGQHLSKQSSTQRKFVSNKFQKQTMHKFAKSKMSKSKYWRRYGWGFGGRWGVDFGWGWGCWDSPWSYGWSWYDPLPVVEYYNPYCDCAGTVVDGVDYSGPISRMPANTVEGDDSDAFATARQAFTEGNVDSALNAISVAALQMPQNQDMHQFHSLVLFAKGDYCRSATVAHVVLQEGPGWTWNTLQSFYSSPEVYTQQLRNLEHYVNDHPDEANARFLLGYHYLMMNHADAGQRQMQQVVESQPKDKLAQSIVTGMSHAAAAKLASAKEETLKPVPDDNGPVDNNSTDQETIVQTKTRPTNSTAIQGAPMVDDKQEKASTTDDADNGPVNDKAEKVAAKSKADNAPTDAKTDNAATGDDSDKTPADDKSHPVAAKSKVGKAPAQGKTENASTDDDSDKTPNNDKSESDQAAAKGKAGKAPADAKPDTANTDDDSNKTPNNDKPESDQAAPKGKAAKSPADAKSENATTDDDSDKSPANDKSEQAAKGNVEKASTDAKPEKASTDDDENPEPANNKSEKRSVKARPARRPVKRRAEPAVTEDTDNGNASEPTTTPVQPKPSRPNKQARVANGLIGTFKASPEQGIQIEVTLGSNQAFVWKFTANGKTQKFAGKYKMTPNSLSLTRSDGETMEGTLERTSNGGFKFRMKGADADDPGLSFAR